MIKKIGLINPTPIQYHSIEAILKGENVLLIGPTGSGKTEAAIFPLLHRILNGTEGEGIHLLYVNPLKALTRDLSIRINNYAHFLNLKVRPLYGDVKKSFKKPVPEMVIITPESLEIILDWSSNWWAYFKNIKYVVIDEVNELIFSKRGYQLLALLERLKQLTERNLQRVCLSATLSNPDLVAEIFGGSDGKLKVIRPFEEKEYEFEIKIALPLTREEKEDIFLASSRVISELISSSKKSIVFTNSRYSTEMLKMEIEKKDIPIVVHHGSIGQEEREYSEDAFKEGLSKAIIATKTLELGIDIGNVEQVIQYRSPGQVYALIQRAGRSFHRPGEKSICRIVSTEPTDLLECAALVSLFNKGYLEEPSIIDKPYDVLAKEILGYALHNFVGLKRNRKKLVPADVETIYKTLKNSFFFKNLSKEEFDEVVNSLVQNGLLKLDGKLPYPSSRFWSIWRFEKSEAKEWPSLEFNEFFSMIPKKETFILWAEEGFGKRKKLGELDSSFVYRSLNVGMVLRFAGYSWKVSEIDEKNHNVYAYLVEHDGEAPSWKGEGLQRNQTLAQEMLLILASLTQNPELAYKLTKDNEAAKCLLEYANSIERPYLDALSQGKIIIEQIPSGKTWIFITFMGESINRALAAAIYEKIIESSLLVKYIISPIGFAFKSEIINPLNALVDISLNEFEKLVTNHIRDKSPFTKMIKDQIREHFGFPRNEGVVEKEAFRQATILYYDIKGGYEVFKKIRNGNFVLVDRKDISSLGKSIMEYPLERTHGINEDSIIRETLQKFRNLTFDNILEYTWANPFEIKKKLREISGETNVVAFIDTSSKGWTIAKCPYKEEWITVRIPVATKLFIIKSDDDLMEIQKILARKDFPLTQLMNAEVEITFADLKNGIEEPYVLKITKSFEAILNALIETKIKKRHDKINLKVHIKGTRVTMIHYGVLSVIVKHMIINDIVASYELIKNRVISNKRQYVFEFP